MTVFVALCASGRPDLALVAWDLYMSEQSRAAVGTSATEMYPGSLPIPTVRSSASITNPALATLHALLECTLGTV